jgi:MFS family permease
MSGSRSIRVFKGYVATQTQERPETQASWVPMVIIALAQILLIFNISTLQVSIEGIVSTFNTPATVVGTAIVSYTLVVAGFIMPGAKLAQSLGSRRVFRATILLFGAAMLLVMLSRGVAMLVIAQMVAGAAAAALVPTLVVLVTDNYSGYQQERALGWLAGALPLGIVFAFLIAGALATWIGWRFTFGVLVALSAIIYFLSRRLKPSKGRSEAGFDVFGMILSALAVLLISTGANNLTHWGPLLANPRAPIRIFDMSPAPIMVVLGIFLIQAFFAWSHHRVREGKIPLIALEVLESPGEISATFSLFIIGLLGSAVTLLVPLYVQVVQGRSELQTAVAVVPYSFGSFAAAVLVVRLFDKVTPRRLARYAFLVVALGLALLGVVIRNDWGMLVVIIGMSLAGLGEGALMTLLFNVLVSSSKKKFAGDVGSLRGVTNNLSSGVGTALAGVLLVGMLGTLVHRKLADNPVLPHELKLQVNLDSIPFISNRQLRTTLARTDATPEQVAEAERINVETRLVALKVSFFTLAGIALLAFFPASGLPDYTPADLPSEHTPSRAS